MNSSRRVTLGSKGRSTLGSAGRALMGGPPALGRSGIGGPSVLREIEGEEGHVSVSSVLAATPPQRKSVFSSEPFIRTYGSNPRAAAAASASASAASEPAALSAAAAATPLKSSLKSAAASPRKKHVTHRNNLLRIGPVPSGANNKLLRRSIKVNKNAAGANMRLLKSVFGEGWVNANSGLNDGVKQELIAEYTAAVTQYERKRVALLQRFLDRHGIVPLSNIPNEFKKRSNSLNTRLKNGSYTQFNYNFAKLNLNADRKIWERANAAAAPQRKYDAEKAALDAEYNSQLEAIKAKFSALIT